MSQRDEMMGIMLHLSKQTAVLSHDLCESGKPVTPEKLKVFAQHFMAVNMVVGLLHGDDETEILDDCIDSMLEAMVDAGYKNPDGSNTQHAVEMLARFEAYHANKSKPQPEVQKPEFDDDAFLDFLNEIGAFDK